MSDVDSGPSRVVRRFDFDERADGNLEELPKHWTPLRAAGFPRFAQGWFDWDVGRSAPPSFSLSSEGRSVAFAYYGPETPVRRRSEYQVEGYIRPRNLRRARACLSACFLDAEGQPLLDTVVRTPFVGGPDAADEWRKVEFRLPPAPSGAATIGLGAWVLQEAVWHTAAASPAFIAHVDARAGAWFDDITIQAVPRVDLRTSQVDNVLRSGSGGALEVQVLLADHHDATLSGDLRIQDAEGKLLERHTVPVQVGSSVEPARIGVDHLSPGLYGAVLSVHSPSSLLMSRELAFVRVDPPVQRARSAARAFGVVIDPLDRADSAVEIALLSHQGVGSAKLPVWIDPSPPTSDAQVRGADTLSVELVKRGLALTGVLQAGPLPAASRSFADQGSFVQMLTDPAESWRRPLSDAIGGRAPHYRAWQVQADATPLSAESAEHPGAFDRLREEMGRLVAAPMLAAPLSARDEFLKRNLPVEQATIAIGPEVPEQAIPDHLERFRQDAYSKVSAFIQPLNGDQYERLPRLSDFARRLVMARFGGADCVYVPQTWTTRRSWTHNAASQPAALQPETRSFHGESRIRTEPTEEFIILHTLVNVLQDAAPGERCRSPKGVECLAFEDGPTITVVLWDREAPPEGRLHFIQLGQATRQIDMWGRSKPLEKDETGRHMVWLTAAPIFVDGVERWLIALANSVRIEPERVESGLDVVKHGVHLRSAGPQLLNGSFVLETPPEWEVSSRESRFGLTPEGVTTLPLEIRYPPGETAGRKQLLAKINLQSPPYYLAVPLSIEVGLTDIDVRASAVVEGSELVLRQVVTNRSSATLQLRSSAQVPGYERKYRPLNNLQSRATQVVEYRFPDAVALVGSKVRLSLRPINDNRRAHHIELVVR